MAELSEKEKLLKKVKTIVRSLLISSKGGVLKHRLLSDYRSFIGSPMPLRELGYRSLEHFVYDNSDLIQEGVSASGEAVYMGVADESTAHVARLVAKQKKPSLKKATKATTAYSGFFKQRYGGGGGPRRKVPPSRFKQYSSSSTWKQSRGECTMCISLCRIRKSWWSLASCQMWNLFMPTTPLCKIDCAKANCMVRFAIFIVCIDIRLP